MINTVQLLNDPEEAVRQILLGWQVGIWTALPGIVQSFDGSKMTCTAQCAIQSIMVDQNGVRKPLPIPLLVDVPVVFPSAGGFTITFPMTEGDEVLLVFSSRCIDSWWTAGGYNNTGSEARMHDLSDAMAIGGIFSQARVSTLPSVNSNNIQIRSNSGTSYIEMTPTGGINLVSPTAINVTAPAIGLTGVVTVTGVLTATDVLTASGVDLATHEHIAGTLMAGMVAVTGDTGVPV